MQTTARDKIDTNRYMTRQCWRTRGEVYRFNGLRLKRQDTPRMSRSDCYGIRRANR